MTKGRPENRIMNRLAAAVTSELQVVCVATWEEMSPTPRACTLFFGVHFGESLKG